MPQPHVPYWRLSSLYLFYFATLGTFLPYWGLYLQASGFSANEIGQLMAMLTGTKIIAPSLCSWVAGHSGHSMRMTRSAAFLATGLFSAMLYASNYREVALVTLVFSFFWNAVLPQLEAVTLAHLHADTHRYSLVRIWGSLGFIAAVLGIGQALDSFALSNLPLWLLALLGVIAVVTLAVPEVWPPARTEHHGSLAGILKQPAVLALLLAIFLAQMAHGPYYVFFSIYLDQHAYSGLQTGLLWALGVAAEVLLFTRMQRILKRYTLRQILLVSVALGVVRWYLIALEVDHLAWLLAAQLLHAATFGSSHIAAIHLVHRHFSGPHQGQGQALYSSICYGLGGMAGSLYSGAFWEPMGATAVYLGAAILCVFAWLLIWQWVERPQVSAQV